MVIRPHPSILCDESSILKQLQVIPPEVGVINTWLDPALSGLVTWCDRHFSAVGPKGINIQSLRDEIGWLVRVVRAPAIASRTQHDIRRYRKEMADDRKALTMVALGYTVQKGPVFLG